MQGCRPGGTAGELRQDEAADVGRPYPGERARQARATVTAGLAKAVDAVTSTVSKSVSSPHTRNHGYRMGRLTHLHQRRRRRGKEGESENENGRRNAERHR